MAIAFATSHPAVTSAIIGPRTMEHAVLDGRRAAVGLVPGVVYLARGGGLVAPPGPLAVPVAQDDRVADPGRDGLGVADVQRQAGAAEAAAELPAAQEAGQAARAGQQVDGRADDRLLEGLPGRAGAAAGRTCIRIRIRITGVGVAPAWRSLPSSVHSRTRSSSAAPFTSPVTMGAIAASQAMASAASPSSHAPPPPPPSEAAGAVRGPLRADLRGPLLLQRRAAVQPEQVGQGDMRPDLDRLPGPLRQQPGRGQAAHRLLQPVVIPLLPGPGVLRPGRGGQRIQHRADDRGALRGQVPGQDARALEGGLQPHAAITQAPLWVLIGQVAAGPLVHLGEQRTQVPQAQPRRGGRDQQLIGLVPELLRQLAGPPADHPPRRLRDLPRGQRCQHLRVRAGPPGPRGIPDRGAPGDPGAVHQPRQHAVIRIGRIPLPGGERGQEAGPRRRGDRLGLLQAVQALGLGLGGELGRIGGRQVRQPGLHHLHRLADTGEDRGAAHLGHLPPRLIG